MTLALLVYFLYSLENISKVLIITGGLLVCLPVIWFVFRLEVNATRKAEDKQDVKFGFRKTLIFGAILAFLGGILPNQETAVYMTAGYVLQKVATNEKVISEAKSAYSTLRGGVSATTEVSGKSAELLNKYLDEQLAKYKK